MAIIGWIIVLQIISTAVVIGGLIFLFFAGFSIYTNLTSGVPWVKVSQENIDRIFREVDLPRNSLIYDLGCGDGRVLFTAEKYGYRGIGYELSLYPYLKALFRKFVTGSAVTLRRRNFFKEDLSRADAVFIFLVDKVMDRVGRKLRSEIKEGTTVISYCFTIPGWPIYKIISTKPSPAYVYKI